MDWTAWRHEFPTLEDAAYLNSCSLGLLSRASRAAVGDFLDLWQAHGASAWYRTWLGEVQAVREKLARLINCGPHEVAVLPSVSAALGVLASCLDLDARPEVVVSDLDFPTITHQFLAKPRANVRFVESPDGVAQPAGAYADAVGERTACVATSHVFYTTGYVQDVRAIAEAARGAGALSVIDAYQATGQVPTDVKALGVDALITGGLKWLLGGPGIALLYVREGLHEELSPTVTSWFADADQFAFNAREFHPAPDARRFELGTPSVPSVYALSAGLDVVLEVGAARVRERTMALVADLVERLADAGYAPRLPEDPARRSAIVTVPLDDPAAAVKALKARGVVTDYRPGLLRASPYFYNNAEDNQRLVDGLLAAGAR